MKGPLAGCPQISLGLLSLRVSHVCSSFIAIYLFGYPFCSYLSFVFAIPLLPPSAPGTCSPLRIDSRKISFVENKHGFKQCPRTLQGTTYCGSTKQTHSFTQDGGLFWRVPGLRNALYYTILYYTILYYTILYYTILYYTILYYTSPEGRLRRASPAEGSREVQGPR